MEYEHPFLIIFTKNESNNGIMLTEYSCYLENDFIYTVTIDLR